MKPSPISSAGIVQPTYTPEAAIAEADATNAARAQQVASSGGADPEAAAIEQAYLAQQAEQSRLEREHGKLATLGTQFGRGVLDGLLAPGALAGMALEGAGSLTGSQGLEDFGRGLGRAAQGSELLSVFGAPTLGALGIGNDAAGRAKDLSIYEQRQRDIHEQEKAWPMLSQLSQVAGLVAGGVATGELASGATTVPKMMALAAAEGGGAGAQSAYAQNAPLADVLKASLVGAVVNSALVGGVAGGAHYVSSKLAARSARLSSLREAMGSIEEAATPGAVSVEKAGGREAHEIITLLERERKAIAKAEEAAADNPTAKQEAAKIATEEARASVAKKTGSFDPNWQEHPPTPLQKFFHRTEVLDTVSNDVARGAESVTAKAPSLDFAMDPRKVAKLAKNGQPTDAIAGVQLALREAAESVPHTAEGDLLARAIRTQIKAVEKADVAGSMAAGNDIVKTMRNIAASSEDPLVKSYAARTQAAIGDSLASEAFGDAGKAYRALTNLQEQKFSVLADQGLTRDALRTAEVRGQLGDIARAETQRIADAWEARATLSGEKVPVDLRPQLRKFEEMISRAESASTLDGGSAGRVIDYFKNKAQDKMLGTIGAGIGGMVGGIPGALLGNIVVKALKPQMETIADALRASVTGAAVKRVSRGMSAAVDSGASATGRYAPAVAKAATREAMQGQYNARMEALGQLSASSGGGALEEGVAAVSAVSPELAPLISAGFGDKVTQLMNDMPKPTPNIRGKAFEVLSSDQLREANAMWEATVEPMSVFDDFASGNLDYDKVQYAWKQYPGIKTAAQMGLMDIMQTQLNDDERAGVPDAMLTQLDYLFDMQGALQPSVGRELAASVTMMAAKQPTKQPRPPQTVFKLESSTPTFTQRIAQG